LKLADAPRYLPGRLENISESGALVELASPPPVHARVELGVAWTPTHALLRGRAMKPATVVRVDGSRCAVRFHLHRTLARRAA